MATADDVIRIAEAELGCTDGAKYFAYFGYGDLGPWCVAYGRYCPAKAGVPLNWNSFYAWDTYDKDLIGKWYRDKWSLKPGYALSFDWDFDGYGDHVGIVKSVHDWGCVTIEGNTDWGRVAEKQRVWDNITCGICPTGLEEPEPKTIDVDGDAFRATIRFWQEQMGMPVCDGVISDQLWDHDQYRPSVRAIEHYYLDYKDYGYYGSTFVRAVQERVGVAVDGDWGGDTSEAIQTYLRHLGYYYDRIDRIFGYWSVKALQQSLNDGIWK